MAWIESHQEVGRHPKTKKLARLLGVSLPAAVGHLHYLWWWALDFAQDGVLDKYDAEDIADAMQWEGDADQLVEALLSSGYIDDTDDGLVIHDWAEYAGKLLERRAKDRARKRAAAEAAGVPSSIRRSSDGNDEESDETPSASFVTNPTNHTNQTNNTDSTEPDRTEPHQPAGEPPLQERRFAEFWKAYPKKVGKAGCQKAWMKLKPTTELFDKIMETLTKQKASEQWQREGGRFIPNPLTWLNQGRWDDEPVETSGAAAQPATGTSGMLNKLREMYAAEGGDDE